MAGPGVEAAVGDRAFGALVKRNAETGLIEPRGDLAAVDEDLVATVAHDIARHAQHPLAEELRAFSEMVFWPFTINHAATSSTVHSASGPVASFAVRSLMGDALGEPSSYGTTRVLLFSKVLRAMIATAAMII